MTLRRPLTFAYRNLVFGDDIGSQTFVGPAVAALTKLKKAQLPNGAFPWFPGGPPSPYITLYLLHGFAKAAELK